LVACAPPLSGHPIIEGGYRGYIVRIGDKNR